MIRSWERRYRAIEPRRTPGGHRCFSQADIERLYLLRLAVETGRTIGQVARHDDARLRHLVGIEDSAPLGDALEPAAQRSPPTESLLAALEAFDEVSFRRALETVSKRDGFAVAATTLAVPLLERRFDSAARAFVRHEIMSWAAAQPRECSPSAPTALLLSAGGDEQPYLALVDGIAGHRHWRTVAVGDLEPDNSLALAIERLRPRALIVVAAAALDQALLHHLPIGLGPSGEHLAPRPRILVTGPGTASLRRWTPSAASRHVLWAPGAADVDRLLTRRSVAADR